MVVASGWPVASGVAAEPVAPINSIDRSDWRDGVCVVGAGSGVLVVVVTEGLSRASALAPEPVRWIWAGWLLCMGVLVLRRQQLLRDMWRGVRPPPITERAVLLGLAGIVVLTGLTAWYAPPNTSDSMAYHMSRVVNWAQHQSVAHYATPTARQLFQPPWAEFVILQLQLIAGSDHFAGFVQWASMIGCLISASLIARLLGGSTRTQILSAVFVGSLPMGTLQASSTQNDYVVALWVSAFALGVVWIWNHKAKPDWRQYALCGCSVGLAMCTKGTSYFFAGPFVVLLLVVHVRRWKLSGLPVLLLAAGIALLINVGHIARNQQLYGFFLGPIGEEGGAGYMVSSLEWRGVVSNIVRNAGMHLGTPFESVNDAVFDDISYLHEKLGIWLGAAATSWPTITFQRSTITMSFHESTAGNLLAIVLFGSSSVLGLTSGIFARDRRLLGYSIAWASGFFLFSAILRWHPWETRLDLPWFVLGAPIVAVVLSRRPPPRAWAGVAIAVIICCAPLIAQRVQSMGARELLRDFGIGLVTVVALCLTVRQLVIRRAVADAAAGPLRAIRRASWAGLCFGMLVAALPWALLNETRPLLGPRSVLAVPRERQYFVVQPELEAPYELAAARVGATGCQRVGLLLNDDWDYPLWMLLGGGRTPSAVHVQYSGVSGSSARLAESSPPCAIISTRELDQPVLTMNGQSYARSVTPVGAGVAVFLPE